MRAGESRNVPFANCHGAIPGLLHYLRNGYALIIEVATVSGLSMIHGHMTHSRLVWIKPCKQACAAGAAARRIIELCKPQAVGSQRIEIGSFCFASITSEIREPHIIRKNQQDVWAAIGIFCGMH
jgi:hypothetical protein